MVCSRLAPSRVCEGRTPTAVSLREKGAEGLKVFIDLVQNTPCKRRSQKHQNQKRDGEDAPATGLGREGVSDPHNQVISHGYTLHNANFNLNEFASLAS